MFAENDRRGKHAYISLCGPFSGYTIFVPVSSESAYTTARAFIKEILSQHGMCDVLISDKGAGFMSRFFAVITKMLGIKHRSSAAAASRTNGAAERAIRSLNAGLRLYATPTINDLKIELILPIIQTSINASPASHTKISLFEVCSGREMSLPLPFHGEIPSFFFLR